MKFCNDSMNIIATYTGDYLHQLIGEYMYINTMHYVVYTICNR